jgi:hypothetical protein
MMTLRSYGISTASPLFSNASTYSQRHFPWFLLQQMNNVT